jgi:hypothetical protein
MTPLNLPYVLILQIFCDELNFIIEMVCYMMTHFSFLLMSFWAYLIILMELMSQLKFLILSLKKT